MVTANDYYPFGMAMPGRQYTQANSGYRYGFNGKENDNEVNGEGNSIDFGDRIYDSRIGRWLSVDPKSNKLPSFSPYIFVNNDPIRYTDPDGAFLLDVHQRIIWNALKNGSFSLITRNYSTERGMDGYNNDVKNQSFMFGIVGQGTAVGGFFKNSTSSGIPYPDYNRADVKAAHFDQMNYKDIIANMDQMQKKTSNLVGYYNKGIINEQKFGFYAGEMLHGLADFYSHSNYIELYTQKYGKQADLNSIPTLKKHFLMKNIKVLQKS